MVASGCWPSRSLSFGGCPALDQVLRLLLSVLQQPGSASQDPDHVQGGEGIKVLAADLGQALL